MQAGSGTRPRLKLFERSRSQRTRRGLEALQRHVNAVVGQFLSHFQHGFDDG